MCGRRQCTLPLRASFVLSQVFEVNSVVTGGGCLLVFVFWEAVCTPENAFVGIGSNFCTFYLIQTSFTLSEPVYLMKKFRLLRLKHVFFLFKVWTQ